MPRLRLAVEQILTKLHEPEVALSDQYDRWGQVTLIDVH
jgi:hypothetical protein